MCAGELTEVAGGECTDLYAVDVGMYELSNHASVYILDTPQPTIIESGAGAHVDRIVDALTSLGIATDEVRNVVLTHVHLDHAGGAGFLAKVSPQADVYVHEVGAPHLEDPSFLVDGTKQLVGEEGWDQFYAEPEPVEAERIRPVADGDVIDVGDRGLRVHHAPGHASHQIVLHSPADDAVFTADALGVYLPESGSVRPASPPPEFDLEGALADVETIRSLDPSTLLFSHFGAVPTGEFPAQYEAALVEWIQEVADTRQEATADGAVVSRFVEAAEGPDRWSEIVTDTETAMNVMGALQYLERQSGTLPTELPQGG